MAGVESRVRSQNSPERFREKHGSGQQHQRKSNFCHHKSAAESSRTFAGAHAAGSFFKGLVQIVAAGAKSGGQAKCESCEQGQPQRKTESMEIESYVADPRKISRAKSKNQLESPSRKTYSCQRAKHREQQAFGDELPEQTRP